MVRRTQEQAPSRCLSRRTFVRAFVVGVSSGIASSACRARNAAIGQPTAVLRPLPTATTNTSMNPGRHTVSLQHGQAALYVPASAGTQRVPLILMLHGARGSGEEMLDRLLDNSGVLEAAVLAPTAHDETWDALIPETDTLLDGWSGSMSRGQFGRDIALLNEALALFVSQVAVEAGRMSVAGFSDGATYALAVGLANPGLFRRIAALSPGLLMDDASPARSSVYIAHGRGDRAFPIDRCGRRIANDLRRRGFDVTLREFEGGHELRRDVYHDAVSWATRA